jgi:hypothetical protein
LGKEVTQKFKQVCLLALSANLGRAFDFFCVYFLGNNRERGNFMEVIAGMRPSCALISLTCWLGGSKAMIKLKIKVQGFFFICNSDIVEQMSNGSDFTLLLYYPSYPPPCSPSNHPPKSQLAYVNLTGACLWQPG